MASRESGSVAAVYAHALHDVASSEGAVERVEAELRAVEEMVQQEPALHRFLETPTVPLKEKEKVLRSVLQDFNPLVLNFLLVGIENRRLPGVLSGVIKAYHALSNIADDIAELDIRSARKMEDSELDTITSVMKKKLGRAIKLNQSVDPKLLGGFVLAHGDVQWDASVQHRLKALISQMEATKFTEELAK
jgi:F-type H+-transporting ATPase subunit delta